VGGIVGVVGGLGGFISPIIFGRLLKSVGLWTTTWIFFFFITMACLIWMAFVVRKISKKDRRIEVGEP
jgi:nitrate/nitrite transporter NarK